MLPLLDRPSHLQPSNFSFLTCTVLVYMAHHGGSRRPAAWRSFLYGAFGKRRALCDATPLSPLDGLWCLHHFFWKALFALKPVQVLETDSSVFWQFGTKATKKVSLTERPTLSVSDLRPGRRVKLYNKVTGRVIQPRNLIKISTDEPTERLCQSGGF